jgi:protein-disulfide isomerase
MRKLSLILVAGLLLAGGFWLQQATAAGVTPALDQTTKTATPESNAFAHAMTERSIGKADAPVVIDEYFALTCPHCAHFHQKIMPEVKRDYIDTGKVRIVFHDFIFNEVGLKAAMVARCVSPTAYYELVNTLFQMQDSWTKPGSENVLKQVAGFAGLAPAQYDACVSSKPLQDWLLQARADATNIYEISSTPTFIFRGALERVVGAQTYEEFKVAVDRQLARVTDKLVAPQAPAQTTPAPSNP